MNRLGTRTRNNRRRLALLLPGLLLLGAVFVFGAAALKDSFNPHLSAVEITGTEMAEVSALAAAHTGQGFFSVDLRVVQAAVEAHPWVRRAAVKRVWPDTLAVEVTEQVPVARWREECLVNRYGELFGPVLRDYPDLPLLQGPDEGSFPEVMARYNTLSQLLHPAGLRLSALSMSRRGAWEMQLDGRIRLQAGSVDTVRRLQRFLRFYQSLPPEEAAALATIDLRYPNGIAVNRRAAP